MALPSLHGEPGDDDRGQWPRGAGLEPGTGDLPRHRAHPGAHQARSGRVLPRGRRGDHAGGFPPADHARALDQGRPPRRRRLDPAERRRRRLLPEAGAAGRARLGRDGADRLPLRPPRRRGLPDRARGRRLGRPDGDDHLPPVAGPRCRRRPPGRAAHRPRPAGGDRLRRRGAGRRRGPGAARRARLRRLPEDLRRPRHPHLRADRTALDLHRGAPRGDRLRPRAGAPPAPAR